MIPVRQMAIAVVAGEDLVNLLRLGGVSRYHIVKEGPGRGDEFREALGAMLAEPDIGIIVIPEDYEGYAADLLAPLREGRGLTPVVIAVPSGYGTTQRDAAEYYRDTIRRYIGFEIDVY
ncbi:MAG: V-type ATP synthase subunit F [Chloroflexota bacterium]|nr:V-type ATP synthase subunit F [Chloroflexota bacterium]